MEKLYLRIVLLCTVCLNSLAQDPQFSQFYAAPLYQNPAFAGGAYAPRLIANYRNQWPSIDANFVTASFSFDHYIEKLNSGIGILATNDSQGPARIKSTEFSAIYSYQVRINEENFLRLGVQGTYANKTLNYLGLTFGDQYTNSGYTGLPTDDPLIRDPRNIRPIQYIDYSAGALFYNSKSWLGVSTHHLTQPSFTFNSALGGEQSFVPMKISVSGGLRIPLNNPYSNAANVDREFSVSPAFLYKRQGKFDQLDLGFYATYSPLTLGLWYRGIPIKKKDITRTNHDALIFLVGVRQDNFSIGYSYDITVSSLGFSTGGSHEISIAYQFDPIEKKRSRSRRMKKELSCPKF
ncbi:PorP/SprF family type IX secretion system membrane protein [Emticicia agri]|uniref:Type IX secretion system membrane protein PorP/SprF n=1 Tax=Emticicia agri TaxID=2492393 RepID=A0A4Q5M080_9BACT|nr:type IX secretion system membrane protein PorP/SprF [Emticicia agri]RYU95601.1 type IX secretion system membrane protein PorP/SprF [Emticicia agri]